ncbi:uncharacterized [Tachysurus ichikawai]
MCPYNCNYYSCDRAESSTNYAFKFWTLAAQCSCYDTLMGAEALFGASQTAAVKTGKAGSSCWKMHSAQTFNLMASQSALPVEHSVTPFQRSDHTASSCSLLHLSKPAQIKRQV